MWPEYEGEPPPRRGQDDDRVVADAVADRLWTDVALRPQRILVAVQNRVVILFGVVATPG